MVGGVGGLGRGGVGKGRDGAWSRAVAVTRKRETSGQGLALTPRRAVLTPRRSRRTWASASLETERETGLLCESA